MSFHTLGFFENGDFTLNGDIQPIVDNVETIQNNHFVPQIDKDIIWATAISVGMQRARFNSPTMRQVSPRFLSRVIGGALPTSTSYMVDDMRESPLKMRALEELAMEVTHDTGAAEDVNCFMGIRTRTRPKPAGPIWTMRGTSATTPTADVWSDLAVVWADNLPSGEYEVVGLDYQSAAGLAARLIFEDQRERPGCIARADPNQHVDPIFMNGNLGGWGRFSSNRMPDVQTVSNAATAPIGIFLQFVRIR